MFKSLLSRVTFKENMFVLSNDKKSYERCVQRHSVVYLVSALRLCEPGAIHWSTIK